MLKYVYGGLFMHSPATNTNFTEIRQDTVKQKLSVRIKKKTQVSIPPNLILAYNQTTKDVLCYKLNDDKGNRNKASFYTVNIGNGMRTDLFHNPLAMQEIDAYGVLF